MPTTVKSLEERIDEFSADVFAKFDDVFAKFDEVYRRIDKLELRFDHLDFRIDKAESNISVLGDKIEHLRNDFSISRTEFDVSLKFVKWIGITATTALVAVVIAAFSVIWTAGNLNNKVNEQQGTLTEIKQELKELSKK